LISINISHCNLNCVLTERQGEEGVREWGYYMGDMGGMLGEKGHLYSIYAISH
jgi:hypothetical protein